MRTIFFTILAFFLTPIATAIADTEPNDTYQTANTLATDTSISGTQSADDDWYEITAATSGRILIDLTFAHADGNIDLELYDGIPIADPSVPGILFGASNTADTDHEFLDINIPNPGTYYIRVYGGPGGDQGNSYTLTWTEETGGDDGFEDNDDNLNAAPLAESTVAFGIGKLSDEDWYSIDAAEDGTLLLVSLRFNVEDNLDLELRDVGGTLLASSTSVDDGVNESIDYTAPTAGTYHLRVFTDGPARGYAIDWEGIPPTNEAPVATANTVSTTENTAYNFKAGDFTFSDTEGDSLVSATITNLSLGGGTLTHSGSTTLNSGDTLTAAQLDTLVYTPPADLTGSPLATFDFTVNDVDAGTVAAQMDIDVTEATTPAPTGGSSGSISLFWLFALMLIGLARRVHR